MEGNRLLDMPVSRQVPPRSRGISPYYQDGRDVYDSYHVTLGKNAFDLAFVYQLTGDEKYARKSYEFAEALCVLDSWVDNWDKFEWLYWMGKPYGPSGMRSRRTRSSIPTTLVQPETLVTWRPPTTGSTRHSMTISASEFVMPFWKMRCCDCGATTTTSGGPTPGAPTGCRCVSVGVGLAALAMYSEDPQLLDVVEETRVRINKYFEESIGQDGGNQEGVGYWQGGVENAVLYAAALKQVTGGKADMFQHPRLKTTMQFPMYTFVPPRGSVPFEDSQERLYGGYALYNKLAQELNSSEAKWLAQFFQAFDATSRPGDSDVYSIIWQEAEIEPSLPGSSEPMSMHFRTIDWVVMRSSWEDQDHPLLAAKGGGHDDPHHGHLDAGQFAIAYRGEWYVKELGYLEPTGLGYWDYRRRFREYPHSNSLGHNVVYVNGEQQQYGPQYSGKVTDFTTSEAQDYALIDVTKAYPGKELKGWRRHIIFKKPHFFVLLDEVESAAGAEIAVRVHPGVAYHSKRGYVLFEGEQGKMANLPLLPKTFNLREDSHPILPENRRAVFHRVPYYDLVTRAAGEKTYIANLFVPVEDEREAQEILGSSDTAREEHTLHLTVTYRGSQHSWEFDLSGQFARLK